MAASTKECLSLTKYWNGFYDILTQIEEQYRDEFRSKECKSFLALLADTKRVAECSKEVESASLFAMRSLQQEINSILNNSVTYSKNLPLIQSATSFYFITNIYRFNLFLFANNFVTSNCSMINLALAKYIDYSKDLLKTIDSKLNYYRNNKIVPSDCSETKAIEIFFKEYKFNALLSYYGLKEADVAATYRQPKISLISKQVAKTNDECAVYMNYFNRNRALFDALRNIIDYLHALLEKVATEKICEYKTSDEYMAKPQPTYYCTEKTYIITEYFRMLETLIYMAQDRIDVLDHVEHDSYKELAVICKLNEIKNWLDKVKPALIIVYNDFHPSIGFGNFKDLYKSKINPVINQLSAKKLKLN